MLIGLTGLHRTGKSYFRQSGIAEKYGFVVANKKQLVVELFLTSISNPDEYEAVSFDDANFNNSKLWKDANSWYGSQMKENPIYITEKIVDFATEKYGEDVVLDAVHNNLEWDIIQKHVPSSALLLFATPQEVRETRTGVDTVEEVDRKNLKRISFWNSSEELPSLPCFASWCIDGSQPIEKIEENFVKFVSCQGQGKSTRELVAEDIEVKDMQDFVLQDLISQLNKCQCENYDLQKTIDDMQDEVCPTLA